MSIAAVPAEAFDDLGGGNLHAKPHAGSASPTFLPPTSQPADGGWLEGRFEENLILTTLEQALNWGQSNAIWPMTFGIACCAIEMMAVGASKYDLERFGCGAFRASPRQADLMIVAGTVTHKMASRLRRLYEQMPDPKYVMAMGACTIGGGPYFKHGYHVVKGVDLVVPVDVYVPGCPPRPEALLEGIMRLQDRINARKFSRRAGSDDLLPVPHHSGRVALPVLAGESVHVRPLAV